MSNPKRLRDADTIRRLLKMPVRPLPPPLKPSTQRIPLSSSSETFDVFISNLLNLVRRGDMFVIRSWPLSERLAFLKSQTDILWRQRIIYFLIFGCLEIFFPILYAVLLALCYLGKLLSVLRVPLPVFTILHWTAHKSFLNAPEVLPPGENGYTKTFNTANVITLDELSQALNTKNSTSAPAPTDAFVHTIALSYKHYPGTTSNTRSHTRLSHEDLVAIHNLLQSIGRCRVRFWIDTKLPTSKDPSFERWIDRGLRPYARYITFICPSATHYRSSSFWLANEYHFAHSTKGVLFFDSQSKLVFEYYMHNKTPVDLRFLRILIDPHPHKDYFRQDDRAKFVRWAAAYLSTRLSTTAFTSPSIDTLTLPQKYVDELLNRIFNVVRVYGEQPLPVVHGGSWSAKNPLLLANPLLAGFELKQWLALTNLTSEEGMKTVYVLLGCRVHEWVQTKVVALAMKLDRPYYHPLGAHITSKVLREVDREILLDCHPVDIGSVR